MTHVRCRRLVRLAARVLCRDFVTIALSLDQTIMVSPNLYCIHSGFMAAMRLARMFTVKSCRTHYDLLKM